MNPDDEKNLSLEEIREIMEREQSLQEAKDEAERKRSMEEALAEYPAHKAKQKLEEEQEECDHPEHDHGICLHCEKDIFDDLVDRAEWARDAARDDWADRQGYTLFELLWVIFIVSVFLLWGFVIYHFVAKYW